MRTSRRNRPDGSTLEQALPVKLKVVEILEATTEFLTVSQVAHLLKVSPKLIYKMIAAGKLPASRIAGALRLDPNALIAWLNENQTVTPVNSSLGIRPGKAASASSANLGRVG